MSARKLSDSEKNDILHLYRTTGETSSSLAVKYGVSTSTVSRLLKSTLPPDEYEGLIQQKRSPRSAGVFSEEIAEQSPSTFTPEVSEAAQPEPIQVEQLTLQDVEQTAPILKTGRSAPIRRRSTPVEPSDSAETPELTSEITEAPKPKKVIVLPKVAQPSDSDEPSEVFAEGEVLKEILSDSLLEEDEEADLDEDDLDDLDDDLDEDDDEEDDTDLEEDGSGKPLLTSGRLKAGTVVQVLPFAEAPIPRTCYLVVDRSAELIAPPLREFGDLGQIPEEEVQAKTLPVFDNHRIAKRYSNPRTQRVIKLPDGKVLSKTFSHLQAKGITRLLIDGRVYSL